MKRMSALHLAAGAAIAALLSAGPVFAQASQSSGTTSGPAAGNNVEPSAATQKKNGDTSANGATGAGAPGTAGKKSAESGPAPNNKGDQPPHHQR